MLSFKSPKVICLDFILSVMETIKEFQVKKVHVF